MKTLPLNPDGPQRADLAEAALRWLEDFLRERAAQPAFVETPPGLIEDMLRSPPEVGASASRVLERLRQAASVGWNKQQPGNLAYIPSGGIFAGAVAAFLAAGLHAYTGAALETPALVALEESVLRWLAEIVGLPVTTEGVLLSGGSLANQTAIVCARQASDDRRCTLVYVSERTHHSIDKALHLCGVVREAVRVVPALPCGAMDVERLERQMAQDAQHDLLPLLIVGTAGCTDTGAVDDLGLLARLRDKHHTWLHVDGAYGGAFVLTKRGADALRGIELADSVTLDAHKGFSLPFGVGALLVRRPGVLAAAHGGTGAYMRDMPHHPSLPHYFERGPELTRPFRGLLLWLPLQLHGVAAFRQFLDGMLDLAGEAARRLRAIPGIIVQQPELSIVVFRAQEGDARTEVMLKALNATGRLQVSSTRLEGRVCIRLAFLDPRTGEAQIDLIESLVSAVPVTTQVDVKPPRT